MSHNIAKVTKLVLNKGGKILQPPISFCWEEGQHWCVTGPSGSGKTTLLKTLAGLSFASHGDIEFPGLKELIAERDKSERVNDFIGYVSQEVKVSAGFYIQDLYYQRRYQAAEQDGIPTTREVLHNALTDEFTEYEDIAEMMNLTKLFDQPFVQLSNGQTRRLMIALALIKRPRILFLDNPYTGLDQSARISLNKYLKTLISHGVHIFIAAHDHELPALDFVTDVLRLQPVVKLEGRGALPEIYKSVLSPEYDFVIDIENIKVAYGERTVLSIPRWRVKPCEHWVIQGANGAGKSTLLSLIMADHPQAYSNKIDVFGRRRGSGETIWDVKRRIGFFSSELLRYFSKLPTADEVIASGWNDITGQIKKMNGEQRDGVNALADWLGITSLLNIRIGDLSLGQQKMVLIARAMIRNPEILILDEPLQGMDAEWREHFKSRFNEFAHNRTALYVTHDVEEIPDGSWKTLKL